MWYIVLLVIWAAALFWQRKYIAEMGRLYFCVLSPHESKTEKLMMLIDIIPMSVLFIVFYIIVWPFVAIVLACARKISHKPAHL